MYSRYRIPSMLYRGVRYRNSIVPYVRRFSSPEILVPKKKFHVSKGIFTFVALTGFGANLSKGALEAVKENGLVGAFIGGVKANAGGIAAAVFFGYLASLIAKPKIKKQ